MTTRVFHSSSRTESKKWFALSMDEIWSEIQIGLQKVEERFDYELIAFVLMSNHYHLLFSADQKIAKKVPNLLNLYLNLKISPEENLFSPYIRLDPIKNHHYFSNCYRYIYQNPVRANLCQKGQFYPYSTLFHIIHRIPFGVIIHDRFGFKDAYNLEWVNGPVYAP